ncbi:MAG: hypothetical protein EXR79_12200 [Myxococcales bacterium]|nr:hypothetical protein [Myxococcales bacterium]
MNLDLRSLLALCTPVFVLALALPDAVARPRRNRDDAANRVRPEPTVVVAAAATVRAPGAWLGAPRIGGFGAQDAGLGAAPVVRCDKCVASARTARPGVPTVQHSYDINVFTTLRLGEESLVKVTSVTPFAFYFRTRF